MRARGAGYSIELDKLLEISYNLVALEPWGFDADRH